MKHLQVLVYIALTVTFLFLAAYCTPRETGDLEADIFILGGSEAGFTAAIQAARMNKSVILVEPTGHPGGMLVEGIAKDIRFGSSIVIGGITREIYTRIEHHYGREPEFENPEWHSRYEPHIAEQIVEQALAEHPGIDIIRGQRLKEDGGVVKKGDKIVSITLQDGKVIRAHQFIDASIEGHLIKEAGITYETIREGNERYEETKNGIQVSNTYRQFLVQVDPYNTPGDPSSGLIRTIQPGELGSFGQPDKHVQGFCYRMVLTRDPENVIPVEKPNTYQEADYEIYRRYIAAGGVLFKPTVKRPKGKTDVGSWHDLSANLYGENWQYPDGDYHTQDSILNYHRDFTQGLLWFLQNDPAVDSVNRTNWEGWGLCKDEYQDNEGWPRRLYIRSGRRMVSDYVITEHHTHRDNEVRVEDPVTIAWWPPDTHHARRIVKDGYAYNEGFVFGGDDWRPFGISYRSLVPKTKECINLITPTCVSSSYVAYGAVRILPTFMMLGQSVATAASMALDSNIPVQDLNYSELSTTLSEQGQILEIPEIWREYVEIEKH